MGVKLYHANCGRFILCMFGNSNLPHFPTPSQSRGRAAVPAVTHSLVRVHGGKLEIGSGLKNDPGKGLIA